MQVNHKAPHFSQIWATITMQVRKYNAAALHATKCCALACKTKSKQKGNSIFISTYIDLSNLKSFQCCNKKAIFDQLSKYCQTQGITDHVTNGYSIVAQVERSEITQPCSRQQYLFVVQNTKRLWEKEKEELHLKKRLDSSIGNFYAASSDYVELTNKSYLTVYFFFQSGVKMGYLAVHISPRSVFKELEALYEVADECETFAGTSSIQPPPRNSFVSLAFGESAKFEITQISKECLHDISPILHSISNHILSFTKPHDSFLNSGVKMGYLAVHISPRSVFKELEALYEVADECETFAGTSSIQPPPRNSFVSLAFGESAKFEITQISKECLHDISPILHSISNHILSFTKPHDSFLNVTANFTLAD
ncbi:hypothetical protein EGR_11045 [Echinococcus granulosus]|uniref:Uncharacterized protein n=1 Tax=Echinococcus granulosus TaxID=6210 RepID=W6U0W8_ECHGR|nr:hypothetical protein EGR_11045 [Echinococcus granulosus]EUB54096.1 hypothetical protein EGR_11045 [Echinococcus granulosus]